MSIRKFSFEALRWLESLIENRFGHSFTLTYKGSELIVLSLKGSNLLVSFDCLDPVFHKSSSDFPCMFWRIPADEYYSLISDFLPAPSSINLQMPLIEFTKEGAYIHYDILGLTYWMLSRMEEVNRTDLDHHNRFPATSSHAFKNGYLERPLVDEWLDILGQVIVRVWPSLRLKEHEYCINISHDVDAPSFHGFKSWRAIYRVMASYLLKQYDLKSFIRAPYNKLLTNNSLHRADSFNTFEWIMDVSEKNGLQSAFYFISGKTHENYDGDYHIDHPAIRNLIRHIHSRGHEIGLHPSYLTYQKPELIKKEAEYLKKICKEEGVFQKKWGGRMHYLRWQHPITLRAWDLAGMDYDSTLGYADRPGFRCGTCHEYLAFDPEMQKRLSVRIRPLIVMECTILDNMYLGLGVSEETNKKLTQLKDKCKKVSGHFNLLWHNSNLHNKKLKDLFEQILL
ncbi:polysaccharide deacetylase family protein [Endozoicomonas sp. Mp262]|uniref:polysaccharide deacetylase family protein n=1 Tax=Endozoicomonas sp. Mp262 TaxID=2919499 RepID=UPI0021DB0507